MIDVHAHFADEGYDFPAEWEKIRAAGVNKVILASDTLGHSAWHREFAEAHEGCYFAAGIHPEFAQALPTPLPPSEEGVRGGFFQGGGKVGSERNKGGSAHPERSEGGSAHPERSEGSPQTKSERHLWDSSALPQNDTASGSEESACPAFLESLKELAGDKKCVAVGEIGLDYHYDGSDKAAQRALFEAQLQLADALSLPVQIHSRDACADTLAILRAHKGLLQHGFLMHCYSYGAENLDAFLELGAYFSFGGVVCFKNARRAVEAAAACPMDRILTETDSPYLSPFRGEKNTPANIPVIAEKLAAIKGMPLSDFLSAVDANASRLFGI